MKAYLILFLKAISKNGRLSLNIKFLQKQKMQKNIHVISEDKHVVHHTVQQKRIDPRTKHFPLNGNLESKFYVISSRFFINKIYYFMIRPSYLLLLELSTK